ncbi:PIN domain-containing protein, partial [Patescibacteria group bacterium]|nr:PIN domain-containing protein [Patescibacteria group bacterium]
PISKLFLEKRGFISTQVIQEFCNVFLHKSEKPLTPNDVAEIIDELLAPLLAHTPDSSFYKRAISIYSKYSLSFYDSLIVQAAIDLKCELIYTEDMQNGSRYSGVTIINPFV